MAQSPSDLGPDLAPPEADLRTAEHLGRRVAELPSQLVHGRRAAALQSRCLMAARLEDLLGSTIRSCRDRSAAGCRRWRWPRRCRTRAGSARSARTSSIPARSRRWSRNCAAATTTAVRGQSVGATARARRIRPSPAGIAAHVERIRPVLDELGLPEPDAAAPSGRASPAQAEALLAAPPPVMSFVMGIPPAGVLAEARRRGIVHHRYGYHGRRGGGDRGRRDRRGGRIRQRRRRAPRRVPAAGGGVARRHVLAGPAGCRRGVDPGDRGRRHRRRARGGGGADARRGRGADRHWVPGHGRVRRERRPQGGAARRRARR